MNEGMKAIGFAAVFLALSIGLSTCKKNEAQARLLDSEAALNEHALRNNAVRIR
jgi:hypothetical protein